MEYRRARPTALRCVWVCHVWAAAVAWYSRNDSREEKMDYDDDAAAWNEKAALSRSVRSQL